MGFPQSLIMCMILIEQSASSSLLNYMKPQPWCSLVILSRGMCTLTTGPHCVNSSQRMFQFTFWSMLPAQTVAYWFRSYREGISAMCHSYNLYDADEYQYYSDHWLFLAWMRPITSSLRQFMACYRGIEVYSPSAAENMSGLCSRHSPIVHTTSSLPINLLRKMPLEAIDATVFLRESYMACPMNYQLASVKSEWYFWRNYSKVNSWGYLTKTWISPCVYNWYSLEMAVSMPLSSIYRYTASSWVRQCMRSAVTSFMVTAKPVSSYIAKNIRKCSFDVTLESGLNLSSTECLMMIDSSMMCTFSPGFDLLAMDLDMIVSLSYMLSRFWQCFFLSRRMGESQSLYRMLDWVGLNSCEWLSTQRRSQLDFTYFISFYAGRRMML